MLIKVYLIGTICSDIGNGLAHGVIASVYSCFGLAVVCRAFTAYTDAFRSLCRIDICREEDKFPAIFFGLVLDPSFLTAKANHAGEISLQPYLDAFNRNAMQCNNFFCKILDITPKK